MLIAMSDIHLQSKQKKRHNERKQCKKHIKY